ncbi:MAG TPA: VWA domain-containing protein [Pyrinomonadaceae bacterium]|jgi:VWFA-related protein
MSLARAVGLFIACALLLAAAAPGRAQDARPAPGASPPPAAVTPDEQAPVKVYTEEVLLPVAAYDSTGRFDPSVEPDDILVLEDGVPQQVRSARRLPTNVLVILDMGSLVTPTKSARLVADALRDLVQNLPAGDQLAVIQNSRRAELLQDWTTDARLAARTLQTKFYPGDRSRLSECLTLAAAKLREKPAGNSHVIIFTDGLEVQGRQENRAEAIREEALRQLIAAQPSVHVFSFAALVEQAVTYRNKPFSVGTDGHLLSYDTDAEMRRWFRDYARAVQQGEQRLALLAQQTGGRLLRPTSAAEFAELAAGVARDVGAQYLITYRPQRPFSSAPGGARRRIEVYPRRAGLRLLALRTQVTTPRP